MISFVQRGDLTKTDSFLKRCRKIKYTDLDKFGRQGVEALSRSTPVDTGLTSKSWYYKITQDKRSVSIGWYNKNVNNGVSIAIILQYGHATGTGGYIQGVDYINPSIRPIFDKIEEEVWKEVNGS